MNTWEKDELLTALDYLITDLRNPNRRVFLRNLFMGSTESSGEAFESATEQYQGKLEHFKKIVEEGTELDNNSKIDLACTAVIEYERHILKAIDTLLNTPLLILQKSINHIPLLIHPRKFLGPSQ